jgi:hypothetical protein
MINERRLIDKTPDWDALSREEQIERVHQSDAVSVGRYFPTPVKNNEGKQ